MENLKLVNSTNFASESNIVYSEVISLEDFEKLELKDYSIIDNNDRFIFYKKNRITFYQNSVIFCNANMLECLFQDIKNLNQEFNFTLISSQSDRIIDRKIAKKKPPIISSWYATNLMSNYKNIYPLPLGIANDYSPKNLIQEDFINLSDFKQNKELKLYVNFNEQTNLKHRGNLKNSLRPYEWTKIQDHEISLQEYKKNLVQYQFILCPWGNGIDTHRIWEALYSGSTPVVKYHHTYKPLKELPVIFVDEYDQITEEFLNEEYKKIISKQTSLDFLNIDYWLKKMKNKQIDSEISIEVYGNNSYYSYFLNKRTFKNKLKSKYKVVKFRLYQLKKLILKNY